MEKDIWLDWAIELQSLAQAGLTYGKDKFDLERYERIREISAEIIANKSGLDFEKVKTLFCNEFGYQTPKIDTRAAIFKEDKILLVKENNNTWSLPGGWVDVNCSVKENTIKEVKEESGLDVGTDNGVGVNGIAPKVEKIHRAIYNATGCTMIKHVTTPDVVAVSCTGENMRPMIDDFAQIVGLDVKNEPWINGDTDECAKAIAKAAKGRNAVLIEGNGALVFGNTEGDIQALEIIMDKGCAAVVDCDIFNRPHYVPKAECFLMRTVYLAKYSKQIDE